MAELRGVDLARHLDVIFSGLATERSIYHYPKDKFFLGRAAGGAGALDFSVPFHDKRAYTPLGAASGPHTQLAQNIVLSFLGGCRIMELKTIQILDQLEIPRPCIDARNIGFNVEWSQELRLHESYEEYVIAWILLKILEEKETLGVPKGDPFYETVFDLSVGYDLKGISSPEVHAWIRDMLNAEAAIARILDGLPPRYDELKGLNVDPHIANSITLSTFHGCPADEIEGIVKHLISEHKVHVIVKMNPTQLGYERVKQLLQQDLGYAHIELDKKAFDEDLQFDQAVSMMKRLEQFGADHGVEVGAKFTNTLVVKNTEKVFSDEVQYLSGQPLHVISMNAMHQFREALGEDIHISFSAGIDKTNFVDAVQCYMRPISVCTDLLRKGGYTRAALYLRNLDNAMTAVGAKDIPQFLAHTSGDPALSPGAAGHKNAARIVPALVENPHYHHEKNKKAPRKVGSQLVTFDCLTCDICIRVCPNAAIFSLPSDEEALTKDRQIAIITDFCNECGNCDTFCPEDGGPQYQKPRFLFTEEDYKANAESNFFHLSSPHTLEARIDGKAYTLQQDPETQSYTFAGEGFSTTFDAQGQLRTENEPEPGVLEPFQTMRVLLDGLLKTPKDLPALLLREKVQPLQTTPYQERAKESPA